MDLRTALIKLAHDEPSVRKHVLPLLKQAGEDWIVSPKVKQLMPLLIAEIEKLGGTAQLLPRGRNSLYATLPLPKISRYPEGGVLPVRIIVYEGSWSHDCVVNAEFLTHPMPTAKGNPLPVLTPDPTKGLPFNAKTVLKGLYKGFKWLLSAKDLDRFIQENPEEEELPEPGLPTRLFADQKVASGENIAIAIVQGRMPTGAQRAKILDSTNGDDIDSMWAVDGRVDPSTPFLGKYVSDDQFIIPIPLNRVHI